MKFCKRYAKGSCKWGEECYDLHCSSDMAGSNLTAYRRQVEYYLSDENLKHDVFFRELITASADGFIPLASVLACPRMRRMAATEETVLEALASSQSIEVRTCANVIEIGRKKPLPEQQPLPSCEVLERSLEENPMQFLWCTCSQYAGSWETIVEDIPRRSFCSVLHADSSQCIHRNDFELAYKHTPWRRLQNSSGCTRSTAWLLMDPLCSCRYNYGSTAVDGVPMPQELMPICEYYLKQLLGLNRNDWPNSVNLNLYENGYDTVGWHADDEKLFDGLKRDCCIISVSLGAPRIFEIALADPDVAMKGHAKPLLQQVWRVELDNGDICIMDGLFQKHYLHQVPMAAGPETSVGKRINLTFRWIREHRSDCSHPVEGR